MENIDVKNLLRLELAKQVDLPAEQINDDVNLADLGIDSLQALQLLVLLERTCKITLNDEDLKQFKNINSVSDLVNRRVAELAVQVG